jgi:alanyl-tRNA synthetase
MASLNRIRPDVRVVKVDHRGAETSVFLQCDHVSWDELLRAELLANDVIEQGRAVSEDYFDDLTRARARYPELRAMEDKISGRVRVVEIDGYDYAACDKEHVSNTKECDFLLVSRMSRTGNQFQIDLMVGHEARLRALDLSTTVLRCSSLLGTAPDALERTSLNLLKERDSLKAYLRSYIQDKLNQPTIESVGEVQLNMAIVKGAEMKLLTEAAARITSQRNKIAILASTNGDTIVVYACSENLEVECNKILSEIITEFGGKGGGKAHFASGSLPTKSLDEFLKVLLSKTRSVLEAQAI